MKTTTLLFISFLLACHTYAQAPDKTAKTDALIKVWGFLKYYHPVVATGVKDWDQEFIREVQGIDSLKTADAFNAHLIRWMKEQGDIISFPEQEITYDTICTYGTPMEWMSHTPLLNKETLALLKNILKHRHTGNSYYVMHPPNATNNPAFVHEEEYADMLYPAAPYRLLCLARYWNMIEYFFPYKYVTDKPWYEVNSMLIGKFAAAKDTFAYYRALAEMSAKVNDSHAGIRPPQKLPVMGTWYYLPLRLKMIEHKAVITAICNDSFANANDLRIGDVILSADDTTFSDRIKSIRYRLAASNDAVFERDGIARFMYWEQPAISITWERGGNIQSKSLQLAKADIKMSGVPDSAIAWKILPGNIGYIHTGKLAPGRVDSALSALRNTNGLVLDVRTYPQWTIYELCARLSAHKQPFVKFTYADLNYPGGFSCQEAQTCGTENPNPYKGNIAILVNETTQSRAEFTTMAFQTLPHAKVIGSQTSGADGNVSDIVLPGGYKVWMTGLGVYYPDGRATQRIGIVPDILIQPTIPGFRAHKDEVLERGLRYIQTGL